MNGMPKITFGEGCTYDMLDSILNGSYSDSDYGLAVRIWLERGVIVTAQWGYTTWDYDHGGDITAVLAWSIKDEDFSQKMVIKTDEITRLEIL